MDWLHRPRTVKFWLLLGAAAFVALFAVNQVYEYIHWWGGSRVCSDRCFPPPWSQGVLAFAVIVVLFALAAVLVWRAARAYRADPREP
jgi:membrane protein implicated in regulation of membrane protease activity